MWLLLYRNLKIIRLKRKCRRYSRKRKRTMIFAFRLPLYRKGYVISKMNWIN